VLLRSTGEENTEKERGHFGLDFRMSLPKPDDADRLGHPAAPVVRGRLLETSKEIDKLLAGTHRIAVLGIKTAETGKPAYYVPEYVQSVGIEIIPVPVYFPEVTEILGERVYRRIADIPGPIDIVNVFRRPWDVPPHVDDILAKRPLPRSVWMQLGIRNDAAAERLTEAGIDVVQDHCLLVELERFKQGG
jgi:predicted CoA-binding protein